DSPGAVAPVGAGGRRARGRRRSSRPPVQGKWPSIQENNDLRTPVGWPHKSLPIESREAFLGPAGMGLSEQGPHANVRVGLARFFTLQAKPGVRTEGAATGSLASVPLPGSGSRQQV